MGRLGRTPGVVPLVSSGGAEPAKVRVGVIEDLRSRERDGYVQLPQPRDLKRGDRVQITQGPFNQHLAIYEGMRGGHRVEVLLMLLGTQRRVDLPKADVRMV